MRIAILTICFSVVTLTAFAQGAGSVDSILQDVAQRQVKESALFYPGTFPTYRRYGLSERAKPDNNIFFTGLVAFTLRELYPYLDSGSRRVCDSILARAYRAYPRFRNRDGRPTFNFWRQDPPLVFPHSWFLNHFNEVNQLPDDLDDTAILWLSMEAPDSVVQAVKELMRAHANGAGGKWIRNTYRPYRKIPAYSTWFGVKMPIDFDFCVLTNILYFGHTYGLREDRQDSASIELLRRMVVSGQYIRHASYISPHYGRTPLLLYHIARLLGRFSIPALDTLKPELLQTARTAYQTADTWLDSLVLSTAVVRLGGEILPAPVWREGALKNSAGSFFVASFSAMMPNLGKKLLLRSNAIKYYFNCPAYREALYLENMILHRESAVMADTSLPVRAIDRRKD
jgi:hypothetical protein